MTVHAYIPRLDGRERAFLVQHERRAAIDLVKWRVQDGLSQVGSARQE